MSSGSINGLQEQLTALAARRRRLVCWTRALIALRWALLLLLAAVVLDALMGLSGAARWAAVGLLLVGAVAATRWCRGRGTVDDDTPLVEARRVERWRRLTDHPLTTGIQLTHAVSGHDAFAAALAARARQRAERVLGGVGEVRTVPGVKSGDGPSAAEHAALRRQGGYLWAAVVLWGVVAVLQPTLVGQGLARLAWPAGGSASFSMTRVAVDVTPAEPVRGDDVRVRAVTSGVAAATAELVELDVDGRELRRWPMSATGGGEFAYVLRSLREPMAFRVDARGARSETVRLEPGDRVVEEGRSPPDDASGDVGEDHARPTDTRTAMAELAERAAALEARARQLLAAWDEADASALEAGVGEFADDAEALSAMLEAAGASALSALVQGLRLPGVERGDDAGGAVEFDGDASSWLEAVRDAAAEDARTLARSGTEPGEGETIAGEAVRGPTQGQASEPSPAPAAGGTYHHWMRAIERDGVEPEALLRPVPSGYRDLVRAYFTRVAADERRWHQARGRRESEE